MKERGLKKLMYLLAAPFLLLVFVGIFGFEVPVPLMIAAFIVGAPAGIMSLWLYRPKVLRVS